MDRVLTLDEVEALLAHEPGHIEALYLKASLLARAGRDGEARGAYLALLARAPTHLGALNDLGTLLYRTDFRAAARTAYAEAVKHHPGDATARINLANALLADGQGEEARVHYQAALAAAPDHPDAHQGLANLLQDLGEAEAAEHHRQRSYAGRAVTALPYRGARPPCRVLMLVSAAGGNIPTRFLLDETVFATSVLVAEAHAPETALPPHDLVFNAIGDADLCGPALAAAEAVISRTPAPVINPPAQVRATGRVEIAARLSGLPGVVTPRVERMGRREVARAAERFGYPLLLRSPGYHTGRHFIRVETAGDLTTALASLPGRELFLIQPLEARGAAGWVRKYRAMMIGGRLYPLHLALSRDWKVHYFTADMAEQPAHRAEDAAFLADMTGAIGSRAMAGLAAVAGRLDLDYAGVDFGLNADGDVLVFEANATMVVNPPDPDPAGLSPWANPGDPGCGCARCC